MSWYTNPIDKDGSGQTNYLCLYNNDKRYLQQSYPGNGYDLSSRVRILLREANGQWKKVIKIPLGIKSALKVPVILQERSSMALYYAWLSLGGGVIDPDYRGEWHAIYRIHPYLFSPEEPDVKNILETDTTGAIYLKANQRIVQTILPPDFHIYPDGWDDWHNLFPTDRSVGGFGSTGV